MSVAARWWSEEEEEAGGVEKEMSDGGSAPLLIYSQKEANRRPPQSQVMMVFFCMQQGLVKSRTVAEAAWGSGGAHVPSIAMRRPRPQVLGARGALQLPFGFASKPSSSAPWARGLLSASWERGCPDLPSCYPRRGSTSGPVRPIFTNKHSRPSRGSSVVAAEAGPYQAVDGATPRAAGRQVWAPPFPGRRQ